MNKKRYKLNEFFKKNLISHSYALLFDFDNILPDFIQHFYIQDQPKIDYAILTKYGELVTACEYESEDEALADFRKFANSMLTYHYYKYNTMLTTTVLSYNPIWNVDGTVETITGGQDSTDRTGTNRDTTDFGINKTTYTDGTKTDTETRYVVPFDAPDSSVYERDKKDFVNGTKVDTEETQAKQDVLNKTIKENDTTNYGRTEKVTRQGNIGVTSTQSLIDEERRVAVFNVFEIIFLDIFETFFLSIY